MFFVFLNSKWYFSRKGLTTGQISFLSGNGMIKGVFFLGRFVDKNDQILRKKLTLEEGP